MRLEEMKKNVRILRSNEPFVLESGEVLPSLEIAYHTFGTLSSRKDNVVWVCHALTADSDVADWWPHTVEKDAFLDPEKWFVVCANILGSHYGTTGPLSINPATGEPYYGDFPAVTIRDIVEAHKILASHLGINSMHCIIGSSMGGFQALEWMASEPSRFDKAVLIATSAKASPWAIALNETQRMSIEADGSYGSSRPDAGSKGLAAARALGLLSYRGPEGYNLTQQDPDNHVGRHRACTYQRHQGKKLIDRFDAYSYMSILDAFDTHDVGRMRGGIDAALRRFEGDVLSIGLSSDIIFPPGEMRRLAEMFPHAHYEEIDSPFGHDGFLVEHVQLNRILKQFI